MPEPKVYGVMTPRGFVSNCPHCKAEDVAEMIPGGFEPTREAMSMPDNPWGRVCKVCDKAFWAQLKPD